MMEILWIVQALLTIVIAGVGFFMKELKKAIKDLEEENDKSKERLREFELKVVSNYVPRDQITADLQQIGNILNKVFEKIEKIGNRRLSHDE